MDSGRAKKVVLRSAVAISRHWQCVGVDTLTPFVELELVSDAQQGEDSDQCRQRRQAVTDGHDRGVGADAEVVGGDAQPMRRVPGGQKNGQEYEPFADRILDHGEHPFVGERLGRQQAEGDGEAGDENHHRRDKGGEGATGGEQGPDNGFVGTRHGDTPARNKTSAETTAQPA